MYYITVTEEINYLIAFTFPADIQNAYFETNFARQTNDFYFI